MNSALMTPVAGIFALTLAGCSEDASSSAVNPLEQDGAATSTPAEDGATAAAADFEELFTYDWTVDAGVEAYWCEYRTLTEDLYISNFRPIMPSGTHHVVLGYQESVTPDGVFAEGENGCTGTSFGDIYTYVATVGTQELAMPEGVAVKIPAGKQIVFGLHVFNTETSPLSGHSGVAVIQPERSAVEQEAEVVAVNDFMLNIPIGTTTEGTTCTMTEDVTVFAVLPHMHLTGVHMTAVAELSDGSDTTLLDIDYDFNEQVYSMIDPPLFMQQGTKITTTCDYENPGPNTYTFGESTDNGEMCITFTYRYPAVAMNQPQDTSLGFPIARSSCYK